MSAIPRGRNNNHTSSSSTTGGGGTIDADSLLASTLLRIRTDDSLGVNSNAHIAPAAVVEATRISPIISSLAPRSDNNTSNTTQASTTPTTTGGARGQQQQNMQFPTPNAAATAANNLDSVSSRMGRGVSMAPTVAELFRTNNNISHHYAYGDHLTLEQLNTLQTLAANQAASLADVAAAAASNSPHNAPNFASAAPNFQALSSSPQGQQVALLAAPTTTRTPSVRQQLAAEVALHMTENNNHNNNLEVTSDAAAIAAVRKEQVEAALRSKPQRGRKREELSDLERMELTRTRNREHARSTRIRKKARYQELLDCEQHLDDVTKQQDIQQKRRRAVLDFLSFRRSMLLSVLTTTSPKASPPPPPPNSSSNNTASSPKSLNDLVEDPDQFCFRFNEFISSSSNKDDSDHASAALNSNSVQHMKNFDNQLVSRVVGIFGMAVLPFVCYSIKGSCVGNKNIGDDESSLIALDLGHGGFANVEISLVRPSGGNNVEKILLMTGVMQFDFSESDEKSDKLRSVVWLTMQDYLKGLSDEGLVSHPSVVSLDPVMLLQESASSSSTSGSSEATTKEQSSQEQQQDNEGGGPGMNI